MAKSDVVEIELLSRSFEGLSDQSGTKKRKHKQTDLGVIGLCDGISCEGAEPNRTLSGTQG